MPKPCEVCATSEAKYKCPSCRLPYCSAACYKRHKEAPCAPASAAGATAGAAAGVTAGSGDGATAGSGDGAPLAPGAAPTWPTSPTDQPQTSAAIEEAETESEEDGPRLSIDQLGLLRTSAFVRKQLANPAIVQALVKIDAAPDRIKELEKAMLDQTFASFIYQSLDEVVVAEPRVV